MLTGEQPYRADTPMGVLMAHVTKPIPDIREWRTDLPDAVQTIIDRAMAKDPLDRYQCAEELIADLQAAASPPTDLPTIRAVTQPLVETYGEPEPESQGILWETVAAAPTAESTLPFETPTEAQPTSADAFETPSPTVLLPLELIRRRVRSLWARGELAAIVLISVALIAGVLTLLTPADSVVRPAFTFIGNGHDRVQLLTDNPAVDSYLVYSPTGGSLAFASARDGDFEFFVLDSEGQVAQLTFNDIDDIHPAYSPIGGRLAFASNRDGDYEIYVIDSEGQATQITQNSVDDIWPAPSPTVSGLVYVSESVLLPLISDQ